MGRDKSWWVPLTGVAFLILALLGFMIGGEPPDADDPIREIVEFYVDNDSKLMLASYLAGFAAAALVFFGAYLREVLRAADPGRDFLPTAAFAGNSDRRHDQPDPCGDGRRHRSGLHPGPCRPLQQ